MRIELALAKRDRAISQLRDLFSSAEHFGLPSATINDRFYEIAKRLGKAPHWVRAYVDGYRRALTDKAYESQLVYGGFVDGVFYSTHRDRDDYYEKHGIEPREYASDGRVRECGHYWRRNIKPFFIPEHV